MNSKNFFANTFYFFGSFIFIGYLLHIGKPFLQPVIIAIVFWYLIISLAKVLNHKYNNFQLPEPLSLPLSIIICAIFVWITSSIVTNNIEQINDKLPEYRNNLTTLTQNALDQYVPDSEADARTFLSTNVYSNIDLNSLVGDAARTAGGFAGKTILIIIYVLFLLIEYKKIPQKLERITAKGRNYARTIDILKDISQDLNSYFKIKTAASVTTGLLSYFVLLAFGVDFAAFWALLIFLLNFIPTIGSILATTFPVMVALVQFEGGYQFFAIGGTLIFIQIFIGSILEPRFQGNTLNISPLVIILSLAFWATIWGVLGALLCIPIMAILNIVLSKFESTQWISLLISADGEGKGYKNYKWHKHLKKQVKKLRK
jgi:predicted PurR-regulated permease PerM